MNSFFNTYIRNNIFAGVGHRSTPGVMQQARRLSRDWSRRFFNTIIHNYYVLFYCWWIGNIDINLKITYAMHIITQDYKIKMTIFISTFE